MKTRTDLINHLIEKHNLKSYLEIGLQNADQNFDKINCEYKVSVDPDPNAHAVFCKTSDEYFDVISSMAEQYMVPRNDGGQDIHYKTMDLVFIDGLHTAEQVQKDFENALKILSPNGFIVLHDCNPLKEEHTIVPRPTPTGHWHGDVYKFTSRLSSNWVNYRTVDIDCGCGVFYNCFPTFSLIDPPSWEFFDRNRKQLMNLVSWDEFVSL